MSLSPPKDEDDLLNSFIFKTLFPQLTQASVQLMLNSVAILEETSRANYRPRKPVQQSLMDESNVILTKEQISSLQFTVFHEIRDSQRGEYRSITPRSWWALLVNNPESISGITSFTAAVQNPTTPVDLSHSFELLQNLKEVAFESRQKRYLSCIIPPWAHISKPITFSRHIEALNFEGYHLSAGAIIAMVRFATFPGLVSIQNLFQDERQPFEENINTTQSLLQWLDRVEKLQTLDFARPSYVRTSLVHALGIAQPKFLLSHRLNLQGNGDLTPGYKGWGVFFKSSLITQQSSIKELILNKCCGSVQESEALLGALFESSKNSTWLSNLKSLSLADIPFSTKSVDILVQLPLTQLSSLDLSDSTGWTLDDLLKLSSAQNIPKLEDLNLLGEDFDQELTDECVLSLGINYPKLISLTLPYELPGVTSRIYLEIGIIDHLFKTSPSLDGLPLGDLSVTEFEWVLCHSSFLSVCKVLNFQSIDYVSEYLDSLEMISESIDASKVGNLDTLILSGCDLSCICLDSYLSMELLLSITYFDLSDCNLEDDDLSGCGLEKSSVIFLDLGDNTQLTDKAADILFSSVLFRDSFPSFLSLRNVPAITRRFFDRLYEWDSQLQLDVAGTQITRNDLISHGLDPDYSEVDPADRSWAIGKRTREDF